MKGKATHPDAFVLGMRLQSCRRGRQLTQLQVAERLVPPPTHALVSAWERGSQRISPSYLEQLRKLFPEIDAAPGEALYQLDPPSLISIIERQKAEITNLRARQQVARKALADTIDLADVLKQVPVPA